MEWWKRQCQEDFKMYIVVQLVVENIWLCSNSKSCLQVMREGSGRLPCWHFLHLVS